LGSLDLHLPSEHGQYLLPFPTRRSSDLFPDVLDLVPQAGVRVKEVPVGTVQDVRLAEDGWTAEVVLAINGDVELPANAIANLRQDRKSTRLNSSHVKISYAVFCLKKKKK